MSRSTIATALRRAGRQRDINPRAVLIVKALRSEQLGLSEALTADYCASLRLIVAVLKATAA